MKFLRSGCTASLLGFLFIGALTSATASTRAVVPLRLSDHFPIVVARIDERNVPLLIDLGDASTVVLQQRVVDHIKTIPTGRSMTVHDAGGNMLVSPTFHLPRLQLGQADFTDIIGRLSVHDPSFQAAHVGQNGYLGTGLLKAYQVVLDYQHLTMTLIARDKNETSSGSCQGTVVPFLPERVEPVTAADTDLGRIALWWDTGTPVSVISSSLVREAHAPVSKTFVTTRRFALGDADFGPWRFRTLEMSLLPFFNGFIGNDFFARHIVCIDFPERRVVIPR